MTKHSYFNHKCPVCGEYYAPFKDGVKCPRCGAEPTTVYDMAGEAVKAWKTHRMLYGRGVPPAYAVLSLGDHYILLSCIFLDLYEEEKPDNENIFIESFIKKLRYNGHEHLKDHYRKYFKTLLEKLRKTTS